MMFRFALPIILFATSASVSAAEEAVATGFVDPVITVNGPLGGYSVIPGERLFKRATPPLDANMSKADKLRATLPDYAGCLINLHSAAAKRMFDMVPGTEAYVSAAKKIIDKDCIAKGQISFRPSELHWAYFNHKYRDEFDNYQPNIRDSVFDYTSLTANETGEGASIYLAIRNFGDCAVRKDPALARDYVLAPVASKKENELIQKVLPNLNACLLEGSSFEISKASLTGIFAEALYRISLSKSDLKKESGE